MSSAVADAGKNNFISRPLPLPSQSAESGAVWRLAVFRFQTPNPCFGMSYSNVWPTIESYFRCWKQGTIGHFYINYSVATWQHIARSHGWSYLEQDGEAFLILGLDCHSHISDVKDTDLLESLWSQPDNCLLKTKGGCTWSGLGRLSCGSGPW